jgi:hypothetical protein
LDSGDSHNWQLHTYLTTELQISAPEEVIKETVETLAENQIETPGELSVVPDAEVAAMFPWATHKKHYMVTMQAKKLQAQWDSLKSQGQSSSSEVAQAINNMSAAYAKAYKATKDPDSDTEAELDHTFNCEWALSGYSMPDFPVDHLPKMDKVEKAVKKGVTSFKRRKQFVPPGTVCDYPPEWMEKPPKSIPEVPSHAHWVALFWSRAMTQLAAQSVADLETFRIRDLLVQFLNVNKMCIEHQGRLGWTYDQQVWSSIESRIKKGEKFDPAEVLTEVSQSRITEIKNKMEKEKSRAKEEDRKAKERQDRKKHYADTKGKGFGKSGYGRDSRPQFVEPRNSGKEADKGKSKGKGRDTPKADAKGKGKGKKAESGR